MASTTVYLLALGATGFALVDVVGAMAVRAYRRRRARLAREARKRAEAEKIARHQLFWRYMRETAQR